MFTEKDQIESGIKVTGGEDFVPKEVNATYQPTEQIDINDDEQYYSKFPPATALPTMGYFYKNGSKTITTSLENLQLVVVSEPKNDEPSKSNCVIS